MAPAGVRGHLAGRQQHQRRPSHPHGDDERRQPQCAPCVSPTTVPVHHQPVGEVEHERQRQEEQHLTVPGQRRPSQHRPSPRRPAGASPGQSAVG